MPLAVEWGLVDRATAGGLLRLWPILLIGLGVGLMLRFTSAAALGGLVVAATLGLLGGALLTTGPGAVAAACVPADPPAAFEQLETGGFPADAISVRATSTCSDIEIARADGRDYRVEVGAGSIAPEVRISEDSITVTDDRRGMPFAERRTAWRLTLPRDVSMSSSLTLNASSARISMGGGLLSSFSATLNASEAFIDLAEATPEPDWVSIGLTLNASSARLNLPAAGVVGSITTNASDLRLCIPPEVGLRLTFRDTLSSNNFAAAGLRRDGNVWQTDGYAAAPHQVDLPLSANVSSITLDRTGVCP